MTPAEIKRHALGLAAQLPENREDALAVIEQMRQLVEWIEGLPAPQRPILALWVVARFRATTKPDHRNRLLRARRQRPRGRRAAEQRDEIASFQLIELHSIPASQGRVAGYRIASDQSAGMPEFCNQSWFCLRWRATARYTFGTMNAQIERCSRPSPRHTWQWWSW
jgi:hypothetical protein